MKNFQGKFTNRNLQDKMKEELIRKLISCINYNHFSQFSIPLEQMSIVEWNFLQNQQQKKQKKNKKIKTRINPLIH